MTKNAITRYTPPAQLVPVNRTFPLTNAERRGEIISRSKRRGIEQQQEIGKTAQQAIIRLSESRVENFAAASENIWSIKNAGNRPADLQAIIDTVALNAVQRLDAYLEASTDMGSGQIINIQQQPTYQEPVWKPRTWYRRSLKDE